MTRAVNALDLLRRDHKNVLSLLHRFEAADAEDEQRDLCRQIVSELRAHTEMEERVFYPYLREATAREDLFQEATIEHQTAKDLLEQLPREQPGTPRMKAMVKVLGDCIEHHVQEEESEIFPQVVETGVDLQALGEALEECRRDSRPLAVGEPVRDAQDAKWIQTIDECPDRDGQTLATQDVHVVRAWAERRHVKPATTRGDDPELPRELRLAFPEDTGSLQEISWRAWQDGFRRHRNVFIYQEKTEDGQVSNFFMLDKLEGEKDV